MDFFADGNMKYLITILAAYPYGFMLTVIMINLKFSIVITKFLLGAKKMDFQRTIKYQETWNNKQLGMIFLHGIKMDHSSRQSNPNPKLFANLLSKLTFSWLAPLFWYGRKNDLEEKDIYDVLPENESERVSEMLGRSWHEEVEKAEKRGCKPSLFKAVARTFYWPTICYAILYSIGHVVIRQLIPMTIDYYTKYFETKPSIWHGLGSASLLVLTFYTMITILVHCNFKLQEVGMRAKIACSCLIYRKMIRLSCTAMAQIDEGHIINLLSNDVIKWEDFFVHINFVWIAPVQLIVTAYIIGVKVQIASFIGISAVVLQTLPVQGALSIIIYKLRLKAAVATDRRILLIKEVIHGIRVIKMYCWEKPFEKFVLFSRKREMKFMNWLAFTKAISLSFFVVTMRNSLFAAILSYFFIEGKFMSTGNIFGIWRYFIILQMTINTYLPLTVTSISETMISVKRIERFLLLEEMKSNIHYYTKNDSTNNLSVSIQGVNVSWDTESIANVLSDINITMFDKQLYMIVGPTGAGKSSLLKLILGEFQPNSGTVSIHGKVSYSSQEPWLFSGTVKNNILFGEPYDEARYRNVTNVCALTEDFNQLPYGDKTLVSDGGSKLSGGQRARINLARAIYRNADIYLLDDCLSAVDVSVGKVLYNKCFKGFLKEKTCILVTHNTLYSDKEDQIILMNQGRIKFQGSFENYQDYDPDSQYLTAQINNNDIDIEYIAENNIEIEEKYHEHVEISLDKKEEKVPSEAEELRIKGKIATILYWKYLKSGGSYWMLFVTALTTLLSQVFLNLTDFWVSHFSKINNTNFSKSANETKASSSTDFSENSNDEIYMALYIYGFLIAGCIISTFVRTLLFFSVCMNANKNIHNKMFIRVLRAPLFFFHENNIGRIINRFSQDTGSVDDKLALSMLQIIQIVLGFVGVIVQICVVKWWIIFPMAFVGIIFVKIQQFYRATARDIRRLEGVAESPAFAFVNTSFSGLLTIRSRNLEKLVFKEFNNLQNRHTAAYYLVLAGVTISTLWTEFLKNLLIASITYGFLFTNSSFAAINFIYIQISLVLGVIGNLMRMFTEILVQMINLERMFQFTDIEQEEPFDSHAIKIPSKSWPSSGCIQIEHLYLKYYDTTKSVLKDLNFNIEAGQKIGIVGRTGAGKSSLIAALFRLLDFHGCIYIDNVNTKQRDLQDVRSNISIIPQDSLWFTMSLRENLDPNKDYSDQTIWSALKDVGLGHKYTSLNILVDKKQLSTGEIQLLSLARTIIKKNKIVVLDEATANVDNEADVTVQNIIKNKFKDCTVIIVAHRLNTIMDSDKVLVMDNGELLEFDHPYLLLQKEGGLFQRMARQSNDAAYENLKQIAEDVWNKKKEETE